MSKYFEKGKHPLSNGNSFPSMGWIGSDLPAFRFRWRSPYLTLTVSVPAVFLGLLFGLTLVPFGASSDPCTVSTSHFQYSLSELNDPYGYYFSAPSPGHSESYLEVGIGICTGIQNSNSAEGFCEDGVAACLVLDSRSGLPPIPFGPPSKVQLTALDTSTALSSVLTLSYPSTTACSTDPSRNYAITAELYCNPGTYFDALLYDARAYSEVEVNNSCDFVVRAGTRSACPLEQRSCVYRLRDGIINHYYDLTPLAVRQRDIYIFPLRTSLLGTDVFLNVCAPLLAAPKDLPNCAGDTIACLVPRVPGFQTPPEPSLLGLPPPRSSPEALLGQKHSDLGPDSSLLGPSSDLGSASGPIKLGSVSQTSAGFLGDNPSLGLTLTYSGGAPCPGGEDGAFRFILELSCDPSCTGSGTLCYYETSDGLVVYQRDSCTLVAAAGSEYACEDVLRAYFNPSFSQLVLAAVMTLLTLYCFVCASIRIFFLGKYSWDIIPNRPFWARFGEYIVAGTGACLGLCGLSRLSSRMVAFSFSSTSPGDPLSSGALPAHDTFQPEPFSQPSHITHKASLAGLAGSDEASGEDAGFGSGRPTYGSL